MKDISEVDDLLARRKAWVLKNDPVYSWGMDLRLRQGERVGRYGWTQREVEAVPGLVGSGLPVEDKMAMARAYWFDQWPRMDAEEKQKRVEAEHRREKERAQSQWAKFGPPGIYGRYEEDSFRTGTDEQRNAYDKTMAFPWADQEADGAKFTSLALLGTPGTGKTHLAALWLRQQVFVDGFGGQFITAAQLVREVRRAWDDRSVNETKVLERFGTIDSLVIDDIGVDSSEGAIRLLVEVLDMRLANDLPTCFTSNAAPTQLKEIFGPRGFSRLMAKAQIVVLTGIDARRFS